MIEDCTKAIELNPKNIKAYYRAAKAANEIEKPLEAIEFCTKGLEVLRTLLVFSTPSQFHCLTARERQQDDTRRAAESQGVQTKTRREEEERRGGHQEEERRPGSTVRSHREQRGNYGRSTL